MTGVRLWIGFLTMGIAVPLVVLFFLRNLTLSGYATVAIPAFFGWCIADFVANILSRPKIANRKPSDVIREWGEKQ